MDINLSTMNWHDKLNLCNHGMDYLKNNSAILNNYKDIWENAKKVLPNSSAESQAADNFIHNARNLIHQNKKFLKIVFLNLDNSCTMNANSPQTKELQRIYSVANIANAYFNSVLDNYKIQLSFSRFLANLVAIPLIPFVMAMENANYTSSAYSSRGYTPGIFVGGLSVLAAAVHGILKYRENCSEKKMYEMHKLLENALNPKEAEVTSS